MDCSQKGAITLDDQRTGPSTSAGWAHSRVPADTHKGLVLKEASPMEAELGVKADNDSACPK